MHTGRKLATSDEEIGKIHLVPIGLRRKWDQTLFSPSNLEPPGPSDSASSGPIFSRNAACPRSVNRP